MDSEKQKQILGYFIEEASDHLNTIESSLVNLQETLADPDMMNELFRAAHSIKGGAAMLGITGMQHVSHNLEDSFKVLKDHPESKVDRDLQSLLLTGVDTLKDLLQLLHNPSEADEQFTQETLANSEPLFAQLKSRISALVPTAIAPSIDKSSDEVRAMNLVFRVDVPTKLRVMLQLFKQPDLPSNRQQLQIICDHLYQMGEQFDLGGWCNLVQMVKLAIANSNNTFRILAPIIIREVKQAQESVLGLQAIAISTQLKALMPIPDGAANIHSDDEISRIFGSFAKSEPLKRLQWQVDGTWIDANSINYSSSAPEGHLPAPIWLSGWDRVDRTAELQEQVQKLMTKIDQCLG